MSAEAGGEGGRYPTELWQPLLDRERSLGTEQTVHVSYRPEAGDAGPSAASGLLPGLPVGGLVEGGAEVADDLRPPGEAGGDYELLDRLGQGGMGVVYRALQAGIGREVALKRTLELTPQQVRFFLSEARVTGLLEHANVVPVHVLGQTAEGTPYLAMKLVRGRSWRELLREGKTPLREHLRILLAVTQALSFAHAQGIIHRDVKPANVMVGAFQQVYLMDWGLAVGLDPAACERAGILHATAIEKPAGTPSYMAPELAEGRGAGQDERTDVYLLGACLHEVLTGRARHGGDSTLRILVAALESAPFAYPPPVPRELAEIANRATARDPADRFPTAAAFREAIEAYLEHEQARRLSEEAAGLLDRLRALRDEERPRVRAAAEERDRALFRLHTEVRFACEHALRMWPGAEEARTTLRAADRLALEHALELGALQTALRLAADVDDPALKERVEQLRRSREASEVELQSLRARARGLDWRPVASPLGTVFLLAGGLGGVAGALTGPVLRGDAHWLRAALAWAAVVVVSGGSALLAFRRGALPGSVVSARVIGTWAAVALACALNAVLIEVHGVPRPAGAAGAALMLGIGQASMAALFRRWLLVPAALFFAGAPLIAWAGGWALEAFGACWLLAVGGVGAALKLGASLDGEG